MAKEYKAIFFEPKIHKKIKMAATKKGLAMNNYLARLVSADGLGEIQLPKNGSK